MASNIGIDAGKIGLVDHREFEFLCGSGRVRFVTIVDRGLDGKVEVEGTLKDGGVGDGGDGGEGEEDERFFEHPSYSCWEEEEES